MPSGECTRDIFLNMQHMQIRLVFRQYIPGKRHKYGIKLYLLCESSGCVINALVYCGKLHPITGFGHSEAIVLKLMEKYMDVGHELFLDNF